MYALRAYAFRAYAFRPYALAGNTTAPPVVVVTARPVGIPQREEPWRVPATIRGRGAVELPGLVARSRGTVRKRIAKQRLAAAVTGGGHATLALTAAASGAIGVAGTAAAAMPTLATARGEHHPFHDDQLALIAAFGLI